MNLVFILYFKERSYMVCTSVVTVQSQLDISGAFTFKQL